ncbi:Rha family transcriptional regulator [Listeria booriae]|uniref:Rha family transcriptional regulator n=1 Tax=Listeria booriae TaxID=1552123 RepID=UPI0016269792|nr:Rha family transcriptional regulator [Listeria booriae]MBC2023300.1 Rha family transcriptional regulator [Listeria booriae]
MTNLVVMKNQQAVRSSLQVAENMEKENAHIMRDIRALEKDVSNFGLMFMESNEPDAYGGRARKIFLMNRDCFTLLAMGFTGKKALMFKLRYIEAFNAMKAELNRPKAALDLMELRVQELRRHDGELRELNAKVDTTFATSQQLFQLAEAAKQRMIELCGTN